MSMRSKVLIDAVQGVTAKWAKQRKQEERETSARANRRYVMVRVRSISMKEAAGRLLGAAWDKASGNSRYPAAARQIFYAIRGPIQGMTGKPLQYDYFAQTLLPNHIAENNLSWDVTFDARGNYVEPHTARRVPLGTLQVRSYLAEIAATTAPDSKPHFRLSTEFPTVGPRHRFGAVLFIEKEGFGPLLEAARIATRYDIAVMSTKGMSVVAARRLVEEVCAPHGIPLLVLHDFDVSGFTILGTLRESTRRHRFTRGFRVIDLGLRLSDVADLEPEAVPFKANADLNAIGYTLLKYGASEAEIEFLLKGRQRVELNALTSPQFIEFLE